MPHGRALFSPLATLWPLTSVYAKKLSLRRDVRTAPFRVQFPVGFA